MARRANPASQAKSNKSNRDSSKQTFLEHLYELRKRLFWVVLTLVFTTAIGLEIKDQLISIVMAPLKGGKLVYLTPGGGFSFIFTLSFYFGILLTIPVITFQIYRFLQPMLQETSQKFIMSFIGISSALAAAGASLAYFLAIPGALGFLDGFAGKSIVPNLTADSYLTFVVTYIVGMAALFQLPLLIFLFDHIRPIPPGILAKSQRYGIVATTIFAGLITPSPDLMNYSIVLFPLLGAFELGVLAVYLRRRFFRNKVKNHAKNLVPKTVPETEPLTTEAPLTSIMEEMAEQNGDKPEEVAIEPVAPEPTPPPTPVAPPQPVAPTPVPGPQPQPVPAPPALSAHYYEPGAAAYYAQQLAYQQQQYAYQQAYMQQQIALAQQKQIQPVQQIPQSKRSIDGVQRVSQRYRTNVHVPSRSGDGQATSQASEESSDGLLTAEA
jgi:sec-independent protein translocase protein TatC